MNCGNDGIILKDYLRYKQEYKREDPNIMKSIKNYINYLEQITFFFYTNYNSALCPYKK